MKYLQYSDMGVEKLEIVKSCLDKAPQGMCLEVGTRKGGTALLTIEHKNCSALISVDPYGEKPYIDRGQIAPFVYPDQWYAETTILLMQASVEQKKLFIPFKLPSQEYIAHDLQVWISGNPVQTHDIRYSYVLLDGEHNDETVAREIDFFSTKMAKGGVLLVDNTDWLTISFTNWQTPRNDMAYKIF